MDKNNFSNISIRGRVAFAVSCLEKALKFYRCPLDNWKPFLRKLWEYTEAEDLSEWHYAVAEILPTTILEPFDEEDVEYFTKAEYEKFSDMYQNSNAVIDSIIQFVFEIGTRELYGELVNHAHVSLGKIGELTELLTENGIELPDVKEYTKYSYDNSGGWGSAFGWKKLSEVFTGLYD